MRELTGLSKKIVILITVSASLFHLYTALMGVLEPRLQRGFHLLFFVPLAFLLFPAKRGSLSKSIPFYDWIFAFLSALPSLYMIINNEKLYERWEGSTDVTTIQFIMGIIIVVSLTEAVRRCTAPALALLMCLSLIQLAFGHLMPGILYHKKYSLDRITEICYLLQEEGIYGYITGVSAVFVALFVIFGAFINRLGLGQYFIDLSYRFAGRTVGGPAKVAVISSGFFGMISGAATANVFATGTFTIPLMKRLGYRPQFAGAVEAAASTGGGLMPPIMGAAAFLMAQITQVPYISICKAAFPAALLYFTCVGITVHFEALKYGIKTTEIFESVPTKTLIKDSYLLLPVVLLVVLMLIGYSPFMGAFIGTLTAVFVSYFDKSKWMTPTKIIEALNQGGRNIIMIACACSGAGLIISIVVNTGLGLKFSSLVIDYSHGYYLAAMFFIMISAIILGMGLPTTAAYVLAVSIGGPTLIEMGGDILSVHLFVFYFAIMAAITPPVALAAYAGASIAKANPLNTGLEATKIAVAGYIVPYLFYFNPGIILKGELVEIILAFANAGVGIFLVIIGLEGWMLTKVTIIERIILIGCSIIIPFPIFFSNTQSILIGLLAIGILYILQIWRRNNQKMDLVEA